MGWKNAVVLISGLLASPATANQVDELGQVMANNLIEEETRSLNVGNYQLAVRNRTEICVIVVTPLIEGHSQTVVALSSSGWQTATAEFSLRSAGDVKIERAESGGGCIYDVWEK